MKTGSGAREGVVLRSGVLVNDVHSRLTPTRVREVVAVDSVETLRWALRRARRQGRAVCVAGGRHAMGAQPFATDALLLDMRRLRRVRSLDMERGTVEAEAGIQWPELVAWLLRAQYGQRRQWGIAQKQTGADRLTLGGALAANVHGRGLRLKPFIADVESFLLVNAQGELLRCSREENGDLFRLVIGGYGLFGVVASVTLRLAPRRKLQRVVTLEQAADLMSAFEARIAEGCLYGDFQFAIDDRSPDFLRQGVFSCYRPVDPATPVSEGQRELSEWEWEELLYLAHCDKSRAFERYARHYLASEGQVYWSDTHQLTTYLDDYHPRLDRRLAASAPASEVITEIFVPRERLAAFLEEAAFELRRREASLIYGTVRLIEKDDESFLAWARENYACVIFNLHTVHTPEGRERSGAAFRRLIDLGRQHGGSYYLTYHRHATREQLLACYPRFPEFLRKKREYDPEERLQSDWYRHYQGLLSGASATHAA